MLVPTRVLRASWSSTLCLPKSPFPPRPIVEDQSKYLKRCTDDLYAWQRNAPDLANKDPFVLHDGPPYANGSLHIGHALNKITKDIILRVKLAQGRRIEYTPGWDCHGLPIELKALQLQQEKDGKPLEREEEQGRDAVKIRQLARSLAMKTVDEQRDNFREWAILGDWENPYKTLDQDFELRQLEVFRQMVAKGLIYRKFKPIYWSPSTRTALAEAELEYKDDHVSHAAYVAFEIAEAGHLRRAFGIDRNDQAPIKFLIWTTTPWTLPANKAIAVHKDLDYVCAYYENLGHVVVADTRLEEVEKACGISHLQVLGPVKGSTLAAATYLNDAFSEERQVSTVVTAEFVSAESGTGLVHCAPGHGMEDYQLCLKHGIEPFAPVDDSGSFTNAVGTYHSSDVNGLLGKEVTSAGNKAVLEYLKPGQDRTHGIQLVGVHKYKHKYPYDWRSKQPVIVRATAQWFADVGGIRDATMKEIEKIKFIPETGKERLTSFVRNRSEWCISRQRAWGVPIPALYQRDTGEALLSPESVAHIISVVKERGIDAWWTDPADEQSWIPPESRGCSYERGKDTMDVWFDSGTSWTHMGKTDTGFEAKQSDIYLEGSDQHRGWFQSSILTKIAYDTAVGTAPQSPYKTLITHGFTLDGKGKKMSKSLGNVVSPDEIIKGTLLPPLKRKSKKDATAAQAVHYDALGADALRLWAASSDYTKDVQVAQPALKAVNGSLNKLRVTFKLLTGVLADFPYQSYRRRLDALEPVDMIAMHHLSKLSQGVWKAFSDYEHHKAVALINHYINNEFSAFYMETLKDRLYAERVDGSRRRDAQFVLWHIFEELCSVLRPLTPLLVEEARASLPLDDTETRTQPHRILHPEDILPSSEPTLKLRERNSEADRWHIITRSLPVLEHWRQKVLFSQEHMRIAKHMGSSLQSCLLLRLYEEDEDVVTREVIRAWGPDSMRHLADFFVVSQVMVEWVNDNGPGARISDPGVKNASWSDMSSSFYQYDTSTLAGVQNDPSHVDFLVYSPAQYKCERCWKYTVEDASLALCKRCEDVQGANADRSEPQESG